MNRRRILIGSSLLVGSVAGCLDRSTTDAEPASRTGDADAETDTATDADTDDETADSGEIDDDAESDDGNDTEADDDVPDAAREAGAAMLEAYLSGDEAETLSYAPNEFFEDTTREEWLGSRDVDGDGERWSPDAVHEISFEAGSVAESFVRDLNAADEFTATIDAGYVLEYDVELETGDHRYERTVELPVLEIDGEWYGWVQVLQPLHPRPQAGVDVTRDGPETVEITLVSRQGSTAAFVRGGEIDDPTDYRLDEVGGTLALSASDVGTGRFEIVAAIGGPEGYTTVLETVSITDPSDWADVTEVVLEANTAGWVGRKPALVEDVENPVLVLQEGREYTIAREGGDGAVHNLQLRDADDAVVDDYETELISDTEKRQELTVTATDELASYACDPHEITMRGEILVVESFDD